MTVTPYVRVRPSLGRVEQLCVKSMTNASLEADAGITGVRFDEPGFQSRSTFSAEPPRGPTVVTVVDGPQYQAL